MRHLAPALLSLALAVSAQADVAEPRTGVLFPEKIGETSLLFKTDLKRT